MTDLDELRLALIRANTAEESLRTTQLRLKDYHDANIKMQARVEELEAALKREQDRIAAGCSIYDALDALRE